MQQVKHQKGKKEKVSYNKNASECLFWNKRNHKKEEGKTGYELLLLEPICKLLNC